MSACAGSPSTLRIEEVDAGLVLPQILRLRATVGRRVSLAPDLTAWRDPLDTLAMHWGVFRATELVGAARLCVHASADAAQLLSLGVEWRGPMAVMSHCVVHPCVRDLRLAGVLDAVRLERARQMRLGLVLAVAESPRRDAALQAQGFEPVPAAAGGPGGLTLQLARPCADVIRMPVRSRR